MDVTPSLSLLSKPKNQPVFIGDIENIVRTLEDIEQNMNLQTVTVAELTALTPELGKTYKLTNAAGAQGNPIYITYAYDNTFGQETTANGKMYIAGRFYEVEYSLANNKLHEIHDPSYNIHARIQKNPQVVGTNCVDLAVDIFTNNTLYASGGIWDLDWNDCKITTFDNSQFVIYGVNMLTGAQLTLGTTAVVFPYYIFMMSSAQVLMKDGSDVEWCFFYSNVDVTVGENTILNHCRFYDGVICVIPDNKTFNGKDITFQRSTFDDTFDPSLAVSANMAAVNYAGVITLTEDQADLQTITGLRPSFTYRFYISPTKTVVFKDGTGNMKMKGGNDFTGVGSNGDWIEFKTNSASTFLFESDRANY